MLFNMSDDSEMLCEVYGTCSLDQNENVAMDVGLEFISECVMSKCI
jgi:hypothetical protein